MAKPRSGLRSFVVEAYMPAREQLESADIRARLDSAAAALESAGTAIRFLSGELLPEDEVAFFVFSARTRRAVETALAEAGVGFERIAESVPLKRRGSPIRR
jgi:hypothetical protein